MSRFTNPIPVEELSEEEEEIQCVKCGMKLDQACQGDDGYYCVPCMENVVRELEAEAARYAEENCKITGSVHVFDPSFGYSCSPEEYSAGSRECYSENSVRCMNRHKNTNYDQLISNLDQSSVEDSIFYSAIRARIEYLLDEAHLYPCTGTEEGEQWRRILEEELRSPVLNVDQTGSCRVGTDVNITCSSQKPSERQRATFSSCQR